MFISEHVIEDIIKYTTKPDASFLQAAGLVRVSQDIFLITLTILPVYCMKNIVQKHKLPHEPPHATKNENETCFDRFD